MSLSETRKEQLKNAVIEAKETVQYMEVQEAELSKGTIDQSWHILLTYLSTEELNKHSKTLNRWTKIIAITTVALILFTIAQIVLVILLRQ